MPWLDASWAEPAWYNEGEVLPLDPGERGLLLGDGVFDTAMVAGGTMVWRIAHVARLLRHAASLDIAVERHRVERAIDAVLARGQEGSLRVTATRGSGPRGLAPAAAARATILAALSPPRPATVGAPLRLRTTTIRRNTSSPLCRVKSLCYLDAVVAVTDALRHDADEALFLSMEGRVACLASGNIFVLRGRRLLTPPLDDGVLDGVVREVILAHASRLGLEATQESLAPDDLFEADGVFATNSLRLAAPIRAIDGRALSNAPRTASVLTLLCGLVAAQTGVDPRGAAC